MKISLITILFIYLLTLAAPSPAAAASDDAKTCCEPLVRQVSEQSILAEVGTWRIEFKLALIGCDEQLRSLSDDNLRKIQEEFREPTLWSNLTLIHTARTPELRQLATRRINQLLGEEAVSDVLLYGVTLYDDNRGH